jgi:four helix bundle protein
MENLIVYQKMLELLQYSYIALKQFPKSEKFGLGADIKTQMYKIIELIVAANKRYYKKTTMQELDIAHEILRRQVEMAKDLHFLPFRKYELMIVKIDEVGRLIGGWKKKLNEHRG